MGCIIFGFVLILLLEVLIVVGFNYVIHKMSINKIINIRLARLKCLLANKQLEVSLMLESGKVEEMPKLKKTQLEIGQILDQIAKLSEYKKD